jgi:hypothetical protein
VLHGPAPAAETAERGPGGAVSPDGALWLALAVAATVVLAGGKRTRKYLFSGVLTKGKKGRLGLLLTPVRKTKKRRKKR